MTARNRHGFTWIELVVVLFVIGLLIAILLPSMRSARGPARRLQCLNNMRNVGMTIHNFASQSTGQVPTVHGDDGDPDTVEDRFRSWPRQLLRIIDSPGPLERALSDAEQHSPETEAGAFEAPHLQVFTCPDDLDSFQVPGGLSYVANGGFGFFPVDKTTGEIVERERHTVAQNWDDDDDEIPERDREITQATGVFWRPDDVIGRMTLDKIAAADGIANTLLLTESLHAGPWLTRDIRGLAFVVDRGRLSFDRAAGELAVTKADLGPFAINGAKDANGLVPAPSSNHSGSVNVIWADGRGTTLSEDIDPLIYVRLMTPAGSLYGEQPVEDSMIP